MRTRKAHYKSRKGCTNCKQRHVKCDEQGPPCANCISRSTDSTCTYNHQSSASDPHHSLPDAGDHISSDLIHAPHFFGVPCEITTLLQLELMHRWSSVTYKAFIMVPPDADYLQVAIPHGALKYGFLLNGILAVAALDIASHELPKADYYLRQAMELYDASSRLFRSQLAQANSENIEYVFQYSHMISLMSLLLASSFHNAQPGSMIEATMTMFKLYLGTANLCKEHITELENSCYGSSFAYAYEAILTDLPPALDGPTEVCFARLSTLADYLTAHPHYIRSLSAPRLFETWEAMYREAVIQLYRCFLEEEKKKMAGNCLMYPVLIGPDFLQGVKDREPMALVLLMVWATLVDRMANLALWARDLGPKLVAETTVILLSEQGGLAELPELRDCISWATGQLGRRSYKTLPWAGNILE